ncbi:MAG: NUDIX hydrolase [Anaerolineaceae bacterium]|nr:MAG: NUDIX hydrolase [Chloroflexota bacterium]MCE7861428.1 NUDIX hydrolase [Chloroflexi bacterium CFX2]GJQ34301.1 MAG: NUDIX hydrolase [Anaerolineaceae bacterium]
MSLTPWKILESRHPFPKCRMDTCELPSGKPYKAFVLEFDAWANVVAITKKNEVVLVRQYRHGVQEISLELPGGVVDAGEDPLEGVRRELLEETGYGGGTVVEVGRIYPNPAIQQNTLYCYLATDVEWVGEQHLDESEEIEVALVPLDEMIEMVQQGRLRHALNVAVLFRALMHLKRI